MEQIYPPLATVDVDSVELATTDDPWRLTVAVSAACWTAVLVLLLVAPALVIAAWRWAL